MEVESPPPSPGAWDTWGVYLPLKTPLLSLIEVEAIAKPSVERWIPSKYFHVQPNVTRCNLL